MLKHRLYYAVKPLLPWSFRIILRRLVARGIAQQSRGVWPVNPAITNPPAGWPGWPSGKRFAVVLSHDVEGAVGLSRCQELAGREAKLGFRSSFNFIPEGSYLTPPELRRKLSAEGFEVGVHDLKHDGKLYASREIFRSHARRINGYLQKWDAVGFRSGFMYHNLDWLHDLNVQYDASTFDTDPFEPQPDGVNTIFPFWVPREPTGATAGAGYVELPYTLPQDSTLYLILREGTFSIWKEKLDWIANHGGMVLVNVHPDYLHVRGSRASGSGNVFEHYMQLLEYIKASYGDSFWQALPREVAAFVRSSKHNLLAPTTTR